MQVLLTLFEFLCVKGGRPNDELDPCRLVHAVNDRQVKEIASCTFVGQAMVFFLVGNLSV